MKPVAYQKLAEQFKLLDVMDWTGFRKFLSKLINLLQVIARTDRVYGEHKDHGLIFDYIRVNKALSEALSAYRSEEVDSARKD